MLQDICESIKPYFELESFEQLWLVFSMILVHFR